MGDSFYTLVCPLCDGERFITDLYNCEEVCVNCGYVLNNPSDKRIPVHLRGYEKNYGGEVRESVHDKGLSTTFNVGRDAAGASLDKETMNLVYRMRKHNRRSKINDSVQRNLSISLSELDRMIGVLKLPEYVKEEAAHIYRTALHMDMIRGRSIDDFVAAAVYMACRKLRVARTLRSIVDASKGCYEDVSRTYRLMLRELDIRLPVDTPGKFVADIASYLGLPRWVEREAVETLSTARSRRLTVGKDPKGVAASALYYICVKNGVDVVQRDLSEACGVSEITIRNRYRDLVDGLGED